MQNMIITKLANYLKSYKLDLIIVFIALFSVSGALLGLGHSFKHLVDNGLNTNNADSVNDSIMLICSLIVVFGVSSFFRSYFINNLAEKIVCQIRIDMLRSILRLDIITFEDLKVGDLLTRLTTDAELIGRLIIDFLSFFIRNLVLTLGSIILMFYQAPRLSLIVMIIVPVATFPIIRLAKYVRSLSKLTLDKQGSMASYVEESFTNIRTLYSFNKQPDTIKYFETQTLNYLLDSSKRLKARSLFFAFSVSIVLSSITIIIWIGSQDIVHGNMSSGSLVSFIYYSIAAGVSIGGIAELFSELQKPAAAAERVFEYINDKQLPNSHTHKALPLTISGNNSTIGFHNVGFYYPSRPDNMVLNNVSFNINLGKFIGIVGRSGSGKSTIFQLLMKFYHIEDGDITVDNQNLEELDTILLRNKIAYVPQEPSIFSGTIKSNISFSNPNATEEMILSVARLCGVTDFISSFSEGLNTEIGERGVRLSGGQKQRIAIARALLYNPEILLLDEATSSIDSEGEQQVINSIIEFLKGKTIISIAHRIASLERADNILVIDKNHFIAEGNHLDLVNNCEIYRTLYEEQKI